MIHTLSRSKFKIRAQQRPAWIDWAFNRDSFQDFGGSFWFSRKVNLTPEFLDAMELLLIHQSVLQSQMGPGIWRYIWWTLKYAVSGKFRLTSHANAYSVELRYVDPKFKALAMEDALNHLVEVQPYGTLDAQMRASKTLRFHNTVQALQPWTFPNTL